MPGQTKSKAIAPASRKRAAPIQPHLEEPIARKPHPGIVGAVSLVRWLLLSLLSLACVAVFYVAVIMGETPELQQGAGGSGLTGSSSAGGTAADGMALAGERPVASPLPTAAPIPDGSHSMESTSLSQLIALFPTRLATLPSQQGFTLESGKAEDVHVSGAKRTCRVVTLTYTNPKLPDKVIVRSAVPAGYLGHYSQTDYVLDPTAVTLASLPAMMITVQNQRAIIATEGDVLYAVEGSADMAELASIPGWVTLADTP